MHFWKVYFKGKLLNVYLLYTILKWVLFKILGKNIYISDKI